MSDIQTNPISGVKFDASGVPVSYSDLYAHFGNPDDADFEQDYLVSVTHAFGGKSVTFACHKAMAPKLHNVWQTLTDQGKLGVIKTFDGCYNNRSVRGSTAKSLHAWGLAIDINAADFPLGSMSRQDHDLTVAFEEQGFWYGGDYHGRKDPMHYQFAGDF